MRFADSLHCSSISQANNNMSINQKLRKPKNTRCPKTLDTTADLYLALALAKYLMKVENEAYKFASVRICTHQNLLFLIECPANNGKFSRILWQRESAPPCSAVYPFCLFSLIVP